MKNLIIRTVTGALFVALIIGSALWNPLSFAGLFLVFTLISVFEFYRMFRSSEYRPQLIAGMILCALLYLAAISLALNLIPLPIALLVFPLIFLPFIIELYRKQTQAFINVALTLLPLIYIAAPMASLSFFFRDPQQSELSTPYLLLGFFILIWTGDTMAYLGGWAFGKHRLFERISPKKSWEGSIIGGLFALAMAWFLSLFFTELSSLQWMGMAAIIIVAGTLGDLAESLLKRSVGVKDSGHMLPGHGGFMDRFDSVFLSAPFVFIYLNFISSCH